MGSCVSLGKEINNWAYAPGAERESLVREKKKEVGIYKRYTCPDRSLFFR